MALYRGSEEYRSTVTVSLDQLRQMEDANFQTYYVVRDNVNSVDNIVNRLYGLTTAVISLIFAKGPTKPAATVRRLAESLATLAGALQSSSKQVHLDALIGGQDVLRQCISIMENPKYHLMEVEFVFNAYKFSDNTSVRFVRGNRSEAGNKNGHQYIIKRILTDNGWMVF